MKCTNQSSYPYVGWSYSSWASSNSTAYVQFKKPTGNSWKNWEGKTEATLQFKAANNDGYQYRCVVTNEHATVHSKPATLTVTPPIC